MAHMWRMIETIGKDGREYLFRMSCIDCNFRSDWYATSKEAKKYGKHEVKFEPPKVERWSGTTVLQVQHQLILDRLCKNPKTGYGMREFPVKGAILI